MRGDNARKLLVALWRQVRPSALVCIRNIHVGRTAQIPI